MKLNIDFINGKTKKSLIKMFMPLLMAMTLTMIYSMDGISCKPRSQHGFRICRV